MLRDVLWIGALGWAAFHAAPKSLHRYFRRQFISSICLVSALHFFGEISSVYVAVFISASLYVTLAMLELAWDCLKLHPKPFLPFWIATLCVIACDYAARRNQDFYGWVSIGVGSVCVFCGVMAGMGAAYLELHQMKIALVLMGAWILQAIFNYGWSLHYMQPQWVTLGEWVFTAITCISSLWLSRIAGEHAVRNI